jgi:hypothetical protein
MGVPASPAWVPAGLHVLHWAVSIALVVVGGLAALLRGGKRVGPAMYYPPRQPHTRFIPRRWSVNWHSCDASSILIASILWRDASILYDVTHP